MRILVAFALCVLCTALPSSSSAHRRARADHAIARQQAKSVYPGKRQAPNWPRRFKPRTNGQKKVAVKNQQLLQELREIERGRWMKVYEDGFDGPNRISVHYFQSPAGRVFDLDVVSGWSN